MNPNNEVKYACLQGVIFIPGAGQYGPTLTADAAGKTKDLKMYFDGVVLEVHTKGIRILVPAANVSHVVAPEPVKV